MRSARIFSSLGLCGLPPWLAHPVGVLLVMLLVLSSSALGAEEGDFFYQRAGAGATVTGYRGSGGAVVLPERLGGLPVTSIGIEAFNGRKGVTSITIPNSVTFIEHAAFSDCTGLTRIDVDPLNSKLGSLEGVLFNQGLTVLLHCPRGKAGNYTIPNSVTSIEFAAFFGCTSLTSIAVDPLNSKYVSLEGALLSRGLSVLLRYPGAKAGGYTIPNGVTSIAYAAFSGCTGLTSVTIPKSVTSIWGGAFAGCTSLTGLYFQGHGPSLLEGGSDL
jgi:hypothetical protein